MPPALEETQTVGSLLATSPASGTNDVLRWPPDAFAVTAILLNEAEAFRFVVSPPEGQIWPPVERWSETITEAAAAWRNAVDAGEQAIPEVVADAWGHLVDAGDVTIEDLDAGQRWDVSCAALTLHAMADEACSGLAAELDHTGGSFESRAWRLLGETGSLSRYPTWHIRVLPKTHLSRGGINLRSLSRYLATHRGRIDVSWTRIPLGDLEARDTVGTSYNLLLLPWPLHVASTDFRPRLGPLSAMSSDFGFFEYAPRHGLDFTYVESALTAAGKRDGRVDAVLLPESAVLPSEIERLEATVADHGAYFLAAGVRQPCIGERLGANYAHVALLSEEGWRRFHAMKHHRWSLDGSQIDQYGLGARLDADVTWWEAINIPRREMHFMDVGGGATTAVVICEDLARLDVMAELLRFVGPTLVIALLMDGPQLAARWSARYASVLADDPGSTVLTLTSLGMAQRSYHSGGHPLSRVIALWKDPERGLQEITVDRKANAVLLQVGEKRKTVWTADGRRHEGTPRLVLDAVRPIVAEIGGWLPMTRALPPVRR